MHLIRHISLVFLIAHGVFGQTSEATKVASDVSIRVRIKNIDKIQGQMMLAVYDSKETFLTDHVVTTAKAPVTGKTMVLHVSGLQVSHSYAISTYHDVNGNGKLDTNLMSIPTEPFGFSNNNLGLIPIPNYQKSTFMIDRKTEEIEIRLR